MIVSLHHLVLNRPAQSFVLLNMHKERDFTLFCVEPWLTADAEGGGLIEDGDVAGVAEGAGMLSGALLSAMEREMTSGWWSLSVRLDVAENSCSLSSGTLPTSLKGAVFKPLNKRKLAASLLNYRPV